MQDTGATGVAAAVTEVVTFDASAVSIAQARRLVVVQLDVWGLAEVAEDARLVVSELLTNAALHARPPIRLRLVRLANGVRIEVSDGSREPPLLVHASADFMTGRGWTLVEALCHGSGVNPTERGKVVWATLLLGDAAQAQAQPQRAEGGTADADLRSLAEHSPDPDAAPRYEVSLGDVPTELLIAAKAHIDALIREFALLASGAVDGASPVPVELTTLIERVVGNFREARQSIKRQALRAAELRQARTRLSLHLPLSAADAGLAYLAALDEIDEYCRDKQMLTLETPPAHRVFRCWYVEELVAGLRRAADPQRAPAAAPQEWPAAAGSPESFERRLLREYESLSARLKP